MTMQFDTFTVRPIEERDRVFLSNLIASDPYHAGIMDADYFLKLVPGEDAWAVEDEHGEVVFYFKTQTAVRLSLQFTQGETPTARERNRRAMLHGMAWIEAQLRSNNFREILFQTDGPALAAMAKRRMGFREGAGELFRGIPASNPQQAQINQWDAVSQI